MWTECLGDDPKSLRDILGPFGGTTYFLTLADGYHSNDAVRYRARVRVPAPVRPGAIDGRISQRWASTSR